MAYWDKMVELVEILTLFKLHEFFLFHMEHPFWNVVLPKCQFKFVPGNMMTDRLDPHNFPTRCW